MTYKLALEYKKRARGRPGGVLTLLINSIPPYATHMKRFSCYSHETTKAWSGVRR